MLKTNPPDWRSRRRRAPFAIARFTPVWQIPVVPDPRASPGFGGASPTDGGRNTAAVTRAKGRRNPNASYYPFSVPTDIRIKRRSRCHLARLMQTTLFRISPHARRPITSYGSLAVCAARKAITSSRISSVNRR